jgi:hypothetical protein
MKNMEIQIDFVKDDFKDFLEINDNSRIFLSGRFGIGKTYFLEKFFNLNQGEYEAFHLFPVNYQLNSDEDIFELLKYDILIELLKKDPEIFIENEVEGVKETALLFYSWFKKKISINSALDYSLDSMSFFDLTKLGKPLKDLLKIDKEFQKFKEDYKKGEKKIVEDFRKKVEDKNFSETDFFSQFLKNKIEFKKGSNKKSVLILDDLDRIDPEHIFRILNVLSAYFERENQNKFGFDKIIIVADWDNIKSIFQHKYGENTDFKGYLDKFYSVSPYTFDNKKAISDMTGEIVKNIKNEEDNLSKALIDDSGNIKIFIEYIFLKAIDCEVINLRELFKATRFQLRELKKGVYKEDLFSDNFQKIFDIAIKILISIFSNKEDFIGDIEKMKTVKNKETDSLNNFLLKTFIRRMLEFEGKIPEDYENNVYWGEYEIVRSAEGISEKNNKEEELFFELLIEYIKQEKYIKHNDYEYRKK